MERWSGKTAVVTGASAGIGAAIAVLLADAGMRVVGLARRPQLVDKLKTEVTGEGSIDSRQCDVSKPDDVRTTFEWIEQKFGGVDVLVNNAAVLFQGHVTDVGSHTLKEENVLSLIDINIKGVIMCTRHAVSSMKKRGVDGHIININSIAGHYIPFNSIMNIYTCTKYATTAFTAVLQTELATFNNKIKTTSISPGLVGTDMVANGITPEIQAAISQAPALKPKDVADAVLYAISTPPHVNISELTIQPILERRL